MMSSRPLEMVIVKATRNKSLSTKLIENLYQLGIKLISH
jgi:hypothetical protein